MGTLPIFGTTVQRIHCGHALHRVPTEVVFASLRDDCLTFLGASWYACVLLSDGSGVMRGSRTTTRKPAQDVLDRMMEVAELLNREHHEGGHWVIAWAGARFHLLWRDGDGDLQFTVEVDEPWERVRGMPSTEISNRGVIGHAQWLEHMRAAERKPEETILRALGEKPHSAITH